MVHSTKMVMSRLSRKVNELGIISVILIVVISYALFSHLLHDRKQYQTDYLISKSNPVQVYKSPIGTH